MQINTHAEKLNVTILDDHGNVALEYKVENYTFNADLQALTNAVTTLIKHIAHQAAMAKNL